MPTGSIRGAQVIPAATITSMSLTRAMSIGLRGAPSTRNQAPTMCSDTTSPSTASNTATTAAPPFPLGTLSSIPASSSRAACALARPLPPTTRGSATTLITATAMRAVAILCASMPTGRATHRRGKHRSRASIPPQGVPSGLRRWSTAPRGSTQVTATSARQRASTAASSIFSKRLTMWKFTYLIIPTSGTTA